ncbi:MAG: DEAD/DEAH box helicase family protein, partial [Succinivibrionaceae bacterium]|nr:DEAD/DEAH box helicase family protein [Succinivibrionaceae bacterium]
MKPEELARTKIDKKLENSGWKICSRKEYDSQSPCAIKEALMEGNTESDYLLFIDNKAIAVIEAKKKSNELGKEVEDQVEKYATHPQPWYGLWVDNLIPLVYMSNGEKILFKNMLKKDSDYEKLSKIPTPKEMLKIIGKTSNYGTLPVLKKDGLRTCQYETITNLEKSLKEGDKKYLSILATGSGKTYLACLASYRLLK